MINTELVCLKMNFQKDNNVCLRRSVLFNSYVHASHPGQPKCFCAPQKARNHNKAKFATKLRKLRKDCVNVNNEE